MSRDPIAPEICASCGKPYFDGCPQEHEHTMFCLDGISDVRTLWCGCYAHKSCQKGGNVCREHGPIPEPAPEKVG